MSGSAGPRARRTQDKISAVRANSEGLRPGPLDHLGLSETLSQSLGRFQERYGIATKLKRTGHAHALDRHTEIGIYRIFQEALTNVARHSKATQVKAELRWEPSMLTLQIADNGLGFDAETLSIDGHLGLLGMQERARELGGSVAFGTGPKSGACIRLGVPLIAPAAKAKDTT